MQFARVAHATDFIYCYSIMESNRRSEYGSNNADGRVSRSQMPTSVHTALLGKSINAELNTFFPFDPYKLPRSNAYISGVYREWSSVAIDDDEDEEDEEEDENEEDRGGKADKDEPMFGSYSLDVPRRDVRDDDTGGLGASLGAMSISPVRPCL